VNFKKYHAHIGTNAFKQDFENTQNLIMVLWCKRHWVTATNLNIKRRTLPISAENVPVFLVEK